MLTALLQALPARKTDSHKGDFGHVLVIGGAPGMLGAVILAAQAATITGAGLVTVATHPTHAALVSVAQPNVMSYGVDCTEDLTPLLQRASVIVIGMGLGRNIWAQALFTAATQANLPIIIDADALHLLAENPQKNSHAILTPHPGEAAALLNTTITSVQHDRLGTIIQLQKKYSGVMILKGAGTLISDTEHDPLLCLAGNPGMATGGMGDILSGIVGGLVAQHVSLFSAAALGVYAHAHAADIAANELGERGLQPQDVLKYLPTLLNNRQ